jgi:nicotinamidase-related amidase
MGTNPNILLQTLKVDTTVLVDINTDTCVRNTAFTAANSCFEVIAISDCVASMHGENLHTFALQKISRHLGWVLTVEECTEKILAFKTDTRGHLGKQ